MMLFNPAQCIRQNTLDFKPPLPSPVLQRLFQSILPLVCKQMLKGLSVEIDEQSLIHLKSIQGQRCLMLPNHPSEWDPCVLFDVAKRLNENFYFVAAREIFDYSYGLRGYFFQRLGVYSLVRGGHDRKSLKTSMDILVENKGRLVIFIEGEISNQNETLLPLESGVIQLALMALGELYKENSKQFDALPDMFLCPVGLRYQYEPRGLDKAIETSLYKLEEAVGLSSGTEGRNRYQRLHLLASALLSGVAKQLGCKLDLNAPLAQNVHQLSGFMLQKLEQVINLEPDDAMRYLDRIRKIRNTVDKILSQGDESTLYAKRLFNHQKAILHNFYADLDRVVNFIAIYDGYLQPDMEAGQMVELLRRMEKEVFGAFRLVHPRTAVVSAQKPLNLKGYFKDFLADRQATVTQLAIAVEQEIHAGIQAVRQ
jgi:1-acyl-sn-glycerol-3-phosphate acyltransferase